MLKKGKNNCLVMRHFNAFFSSHAARKTKKYVDQIEETSLQSESAINSRFLTRILGATRSKWVAVLSKHPELKALKTNDVVNSVEMLKSFNYSCNDILSTPKILIYNKLTLENRHIVLRECSLRFITISLLSKYISVINKPVSLLKAEGVISDSTNVLEGLISCFDDVSLDMLDSTCDDQLKLSILRQRVLNGFLRARLDCSDTELAKLWRSYARVRHKSFSSVKMMTKLLLEDLQFPKDRIKKNGYLLYGDPDNVKRILMNIKSINGIDIREIVYRRPKILMSSCDALLKTLEHVKSFGIGEEAIICCSEVLTLGPDTVLERLRELQEIKEFQVLVSNPRVLRLVHYQNKARLRLEYLNQMKVRCASLHILSCGSDAFAKFARDGSDRTKGCDIVILLGKLMEKDEVDLRNLLSRHPNWCHIPVLQVKKNYDYLLSKMFNINDIYRNIHLLLYPINRIEEKQMQLQDPGFLRQLQVGLTYTELSQSQILTLILYLIEFEFHFTGDGVWTEQHTQNVENFNNLLPDFPESRQKVYKFGVKPAVRNIEKAIRS